MSGDNSEITPKKFKNKNMAKTSKTSKPKDNLEFLDTHRKPIYLSLLVLIAICVTLILGLQVWSLMLDIDAMSPSPYINRTRK